MRTQGNWGRPADGIAARGRAVRHPAHWSQQPPPDRAGEPQAPANLPAAVRDPGLARLEAILFAAREPLSTRKLAELAGLEDGTRARTLVRQLNQEYDRLGRAFRAEEIAGGFQLLTRPMFASWLQRLGHAPAELRLSQPALETLAVIAYRQPVLKADLEGIRGVHCGEILRLLMARDLVRIGGRSEELGRPYLYTTTKRFLQVFGLKNLDDLPVLSGAGPGSLPPIAKETDVGHHSPFDPEPKEAKTSLSDAVAEASRSPHDHKESPVSVRISSDRISSDLAYEDEVRGKPSPALLPEPRLDDDDDFEDEDDDFEDDEEDDLDDDEEDDEEEDDVDDEEEEDDFEDDEWEEVDDEEDDEEEDEEDDLDDEEEDDWDDEDDDLDDDEEEEEEDDE